MSDQLNHIAFIPDGNRRYAKERGMSSFEGHALGYERFKDVVQWCKDLGINEVTFWGFSTENWKRSKEEVGYLMDLFVRMLTRDLADLAKDGVRVRVIGRRTDLPNNVQKAILHAEESTAHCTERFVNLLFNYGGRVEYIEAVKSVIAAGVKPEEVTEELVKSHLWSAAITDPDLIVRSSGEQRLSGFLPWGSTYSELYFAPMHWPAFERKDLEEAIEWYNGRERRFGGNSKPA